MTNVRMRRVLDEEFGTAIAVLAPYSAEFLASLKAAGVRGRFNPEDKAWFFKEAEAPRALELAEQHLGRLAWDDMILRDYEGLGAPADTEYEQMRATPEDFAVLGLRPGAGLEECRQAYKARRDLFYDQRLTPREWEMTREAFERIQRYESD